MLNRILMESKSGAIKEQANMKAFETRFLGYTSESDADGTWIEVDDYWRIPRDSGHPIGSYAELLRKIARVNFHNPGQRALFRGQHADHMVNAAGDEGKISSLYPSIFRNVRSEAKGNLSNREIVEKRFEILDAASTALVEAWDEPSIRKNEQLRWAIIQHYEICATPLLDVTPDIDVAISFAIESAKKEAYIYLFGIPNFSETISTSIVAETQLIQLPQFCPPEFLRPHFQTGYLVGEYPPVPEYNTASRGETKSHYNFSLRLLAKFRLQSPLEWKDFSGIPDSILRPQESDFVYDMVEKTSNKVQPMFEELNSLMAGKTKA